MLMNKNIMLIAGGIALLGIVGISYYQKDISQALTDLLGNTDSITSTSPVNPSTGESYNISGGANTAYIDSSATGTQASSSSGTSYVAPTSAQLATINNYMSNASTGSNVVVGSGAGEVVYTKPANTTQAATYNVMIMGVNYTGTIGQQNPALENAILQYGGSYQNYLNAINTGST